MNFAAFLSQNAPLAETSGVYYAFSHSDPMGQGIVLLLLVFSVITWCFMLIKGISLSQAYRDCRQFIQELRSRRNPMMLLQLAKQSDSPSARIFAAACRSMTVIYGTPEQLQLRNRRPMTDAEIAVVRSSMEEAVAEQIQFLEDKLVFLMTAVSISPFLGLFGTVWGIMLAFTEMAIQGRPDVSTLAPGISGALLTTVLGLVVAIPSLVGYNMITFYIRQITVYMDNFVEETIAKFKLEQISTTQNSGSAE